MQEGNVVLQKSLLFGCGTDALVKHFFVFEASSFTLLQSPLY